jgi:hypothetical protein
MDKRRQHTIGFVTFLLCLAVNAAILPFPGPLRAFRGQAGEDILQRGDKTGVPPDEALEPSDPRERARRATKSRLYNRGGHDLTTLDPGLSINEISCGLLEPLLPTGYTPVIVLATVASAQPYLTEDKSFIYTEFGVRTEELLKLDAAPLPLSGDLLVVDRGGGRLRLRTGRVLRYDSAGSSMASPLRPGRRYVLFLNRIFDGECLHLGRAVELREGQAYYLGEHDGQERLFGEIEGVRSELSQEGAFLDLLRWAIASPPSPRFYSALPEDR